METGTTQIKAVMFDFGGVITRSMKEMLGDVLENVDTDLRTAMASMMQVFGSAVDTDDVPHRAERGLATKTELIEWVDRAVPGAARMVDPDLPDSFAHRLEAHPATEQLVLDLNARGIRIAVVSNMFREWQPAVDRIFTYQDRFDTLIWSWEVGLRKPDPAIYRLALDRLGVTPDEALYLDDFPAMVHGAREVGIDAIHVEDHNTAFAAVRERLA